MVLTNRHRQIFGMKGSRITDTRYRQIETDETPLTQDVNQNVTPSGKDVVTLQETQSVQIISLGVNLMVIKLKQSEAIVIQKERKDPQNTLKITN